MRTQIAPGVWRDDGPVYFYHISQRSYLVGHGSDGTGGWKHNGSMSGERFRPRGGSVRRLPDHVCGNCGKTFSPRRAANVYCSPSCRIWGLAALARMPRPACSICGQPVKKARAKMCSVACANQSLRRR